MNTKQTLRVLKDKGFIIETDWWSPEQYDNIREFMATLLQHHVPAEYVEKNVELFVLCENYEPFKNRMTGVIKDLWFTESNFKMIAQGCYDILAEQPDLEDWQIKLKDGFKEMI